MTYNPDTYWPDKGDEFTERLKQEKLILRELDGIEFDSILEFGCGYGRITGLINDNYKAKYIGFDMSKGRVAYTKFRYPDTDIRYATIDTFKTPQESFDVVLGVEVLMHIPPSKIEGTIKRLMHFTKKYFVSLDFYPRNFLPDAPLANHNFFYRYNKYFEKYGKVKIIRINELQALFIVEKNGV